MPNRPKPQKPGVITPTDSEYAEKREAAIRASAARNRKLHPEHLPKILALRADGQTSEQIGRRFGVAGSTVDTFLHRSRRK